MSSLPASVRPRALAACGKPAEAGFSMVEMLLVLATVAILFGAVYAGFDRLSRSYTAENVKAGSQQSVRNAVEMMVQDIRLAGLNPLRTAAAGILEATGTRLHFTADANFDGDVADEFEEITYELNGSALRQTNHLGTEVLLEDVAALSFRYFDGGDVQIPFPIDDTAELAAIRSVEISLNLIRPSGRGQTVAREYTTRVRCRNL
ncbi:MAG: prepilin-type N-terminal cleavage/methylation domain-containing protein [Desulfobacterales bacterium]|jgi:type IV pilus assembly protein PilW|nr:prepilin-type N-terminal cleavage/methylation domain-containing protein [Desulfobacterales bacterium]